MLSSHTVGFQWPDNSNLANLTPGLCRSSWSWLWPLGLIEEVNTSRYGLIRSVRIRTAKTELVRPGA